MRVRVDGALRFGVVSKNIIMPVIRKVGASGASGYEIEFAGAAIEALSIEARMTIYNWPSRAVRAARSRAARTGRF